MWFYPQLSPYFHYGSGTVRWSSQCTKALTGSVVSPAGGIAIDKETCELLGKIRDGDTKWVNQQSPLRLNSKQKIYKTGIYYNG